MTEQALTEPLIDSEELEAIIREVLDALVVNAGMDPEGPLPPEPGVDPGPMHGIIPVEASTEARLVIECDTRVCAGLARCWGLIGPDGASLDDARDALGELCNLVGATVKTVFAEESSVGIPDVIQGPAPAWDPEVVEVLHGAGRFVAQFGLA